MAVSRSQSCPDRRPSSAIFRSRIRGAVAKYPGIKDSKSHIREKAREGAERVRASELEYRAWVKKTKAEAIPSFKLPEDAYKGKISADDQVREYVKKSKAHTAEQEEKYYAFLRDVHHRQHERMKQNLTETKEAAGSFADVQAAMEKERAVKLKANKKDWRDKEDGYWSWLESTKTDIARRPGSAPSARSSGVESVDNIARRRKAEMSREQKARAREYAGWLDSVNKPKFKMPPPEGHTVEEREKLIAELATKGLQKLSTQTCEYRRWITEVNDREHTRMMLKVKDKLQADREYYHAQMASAGDRAQKNAEALQEKERIEAESLKALQEMQARVDAKPLLVEDAYHIGRFIPPRLRALC